MNNSRTTPANSNLPHAPGQLSKEAKDWWFKICSGWQLDDSSLLILESALECFDTMRAAQKILKKSGIVVKDRFDVPKVHPATLIERDAKLSMSKLFKTLNLDVEPLRDGRGRPPGK